MAPVLRGHAKTVVGLLLFGGAMFSLPYHLRSLNTHTSEKELLTGTYLRRSSCSLSTIYTYSHSLIPIRISR